MSLGAREMFPADIKYYNEAFSARTQKQEC